MRRLLARLALAVAALASGPAPAQQVVIDRVEQMPALPADYLLRDWGRVATAYDSLVFDPARTGTYAPFVERYEGTVNYPAHGAFGIETYVGGGNEVPGEAINVLPALVGATLNGANKRSQFGTDWVLRAEEFFGRASGEGVYLNTPTARSGQDWWYDTMPNVFFYQLRDLYPGVGNSDAQFVSVAERWLDAVEALGGSAAPWAVPSFNARAISLATLRPLTSGVHEPEAAGALAWILYHAYRETGDERYRIGAELALDDLDRRTQNPSYELQLPYGALAAARMNAELGTSYDVEKLVRWSFEVGPLRNWGTVVGTWGGRSVSGLVGEARYEHYAFALNGFQQAAALVPLVRYDDRFARAVGRWMVNLASASRLFYGPFLPDANQDNEAWVAANDPLGVVAYEGLRERVGTTSPYATGDAMRSGWAPTNLGLYGSSSVGYLAALVDSTAVPGVLRLDLRATDFYAAPSYASVLVYNPTAADATVAVPLPFGTYDVYDAAADAFLARGVSRSASVTVPPDAARVLVFPVANGAETRENGRLLVNGIVVDHRADLPADRPPRVRALVASDTTLSVGQEATLWCTGGDAEGAVSVAWSAEAGVLAPDGARATWSGAAVGDVPVRCAVTDAAGQTAEASVTLRVLANQAPQSVTVTASPGVADVGGSTALACAASDPDGDALTFSWAAEAGAIDGDGAEVTYRAPGTAGRVRVTCTASDPSGAAASGEAVVTVGRLVLDLGLDAGAADASPFGNDGEVLGPVAAPGRTGVPGTALRFDGADDLVRVPDHPTLDMAEAVTVSVWARPDDGPDRERFIVSHGSWQNRWKLSLTPEGRPRWTVRTEAGVVDLDAPAAAVPEAFVHLAATYDGAELALYVDGDRVATAPHTGRMPSAGLPLLLGQMLPGQADYNFAGVLDDVRLYNRALTATEVEALSRGETAGEGGGRVAPFALGPPRPNPTAAATAVRLTVPEAGVVRVVVFDALGRAVATLHDGPVGAGEVDVRWDGARRSAAGVYVIRATMGERSASRRVLIVR